MTTPLVPPGRIIPDHTHLPPSPTAVDPKLLYLPDHTSLPCEDNRAASSTPEHPRSTLLTSAIEPVLWRLHPEGQYFVGQNLLIYYGLTDPLERGAVRPGWFYVAGASPKFNGKTRYSYVWWQEGLLPSVIIEFATGDGSAERDRTPWVGKFWIYEHILRPAYYGIYAVNSGRVEVYEFHTVDFVALKPNSHGRFAVESMGVELGIWHGVYKGIDRAWLRWWNDQGALLPAAEELGGQRHRRADSERSQADHERRLRQAAEALAVKERERAERLAARLRELGEEPE